MLFTNLFLAALCGILASATYVCPVMPSMMDMDALQYAYVVQNLLTQYYMSVPVNTTFFSGLPMANMTASNGQTLAQNTVANVEGLQTQAMLGSSAIEMELSSFSSFQNSTCNYMLPTAPDAMTHLMNAFHIEASLCGAFIGLADYFQSPTLNSLSARLAAEHGIHAAAIRAMLQPVGFMANSTMLTPAFTPDTVLMSGSDVGMLGAYLGGCASAPQAPCGGQVSFGDLLPMLSGQTMTSNCTASSSGMSATATSASPVGTFTGGAMSKHSSSFAAVAIPAGLAWLLA